MGRLVLSVLDFVEDKFGLSENGGFVSLGGGEGGIDVVGGKGASVNDVCSEFGLLPIASGADEVASRALIEVV